MVDNRNLQPVGEGGLDDGAAQVAVASGYGDHALGHGRLRGKKTV
jgi:hypothetical protein